MIAIVKKAAIIIYIIIYYQLITGINCICLVVTHSKGAQVGSRIRVFKQSNVTVDNSG